ncbi:adaptor protein MecA [Heliorestis acidaminivorans]|nr:adaptor protein MecA [Heliorestis acidaminivorans]
MKIEKMDQERLQLLVSTSELTQYDIDIKDLWQNTAGAQKFFLSIMKKLKKKQINHLEQEDIDFSVEAIGLVPEGVIVILNQCGYYVQEQECIAINEDATLIDDKLCFSFSNLEDLYELCQRLKNIGKEEGSLYHYKDSFYLILPDSEATSSQTIALLGEYGEKSNLMTCVLYEHGTLIEKYEAPRFVSQLF